MRHWIWVLIVGGFMFFRVRHLKNGKEEIDEKVLMDQYCIISLKWM